MANDSIFSDLKVVDLASFIAGPSAAVILSDFGADVIKVESPAGDILIIECTDPLAAIDIPNLLRETGDTLEDSTRAASVLTFRIRKR